MKIEFNREYASLANFVEMIPFRFDKEGRSIYKARNEIKVFQEKGYTLNVKSYRIPIFINRVIYTFFRKSKAHRAYKYAFELTKRGFITPTPIAYVSTFKNCLLYRSFFISMHTPLEGNMRLFTDGDETLEGKEQLMEDFAKYTAKLHNAGVLHCDYSPGNILYKKEENGYVFSLIDINRMKFCDVDMRTGCESFCRMQGTDEFFSKVASIYAKERGFDEQECVRLFLLYKMKDRRKRNFKQKLRNR
ncbi:MAG TPA: lipopolysaccharide kinase InaA family protein [Paludibacteraceae bacterium]|jgi:tRNA A-37 threonylcarbamoyl transferase component Bud32|nr:lipopolysaccharide kinase InaA family protein [Paludibacteraceae bacterium]HOU67308.1 lipopolysaccharide kinase InaA family protein [Paludibacteraceae bacterium]HQF49428.1 lipopolysaccharide kinase InaA family protein [Paludibacteraceae bacterium]HQJ89519.1 lipopolysaccharide kinase InaA family protein [Paludibacteraceae bacterium]